VEGRREPALAGAAGDLPLCDRRAPGAGRRRRGPGPVRLRDLLIVDAARELLACPACGGGLRGDWTCRGCGVAYGEEDGVARLRLAGDRRTEAVRAFYEVAPFPGYPPRDSLAWLRARAERSRFARMLDQAIPGDARICEVGCGTGQMSLYLARADRVVVGADLTMASLKLAAAAAGRFGVTSARFVESDLNHPGLATGAFDVVVSLGVL